jgi:hypothetical protein
MRDRRLPLDESEGHALIRLWSVAWLGAAVIGVANGVAREATYGRVASENVAHQVSGVTAIAAFTLYFKALQRRWPLESDAQAAAIGAMWLAQTVGFEFTFGRLVAKKSWGELLDDYDLRRGRTWPIVLAWIALGPIATRPRD